MAHAKGPYRKVHPMNPQRYCGIGTTPSTTDPDDDQWEIIAEICTGPTERDDAALFIAAPDLLAALEPFAALLTYNDHDDDEDFEVVIEAGDVNRAKAAIAKAKGEQP